MCWFGLSRHSDREAREPLLPQYEEETSLQQQLHKKLHAYQTIRALSRGFMPSNEQLVAGLRALISSTPLNPSEDQLSDAGLALALYIRRLLEQVVEFLSHKNNQDQVQDFVWYLSKARVSLDTSDLARRVSRARIQADTSAAYRSLQTIGLLLLGNSEFRMFLSDLATVGREVFRDTAFTLSEVSHDAGKQLEPSNDQQMAIIAPSSGHDGPPSRQDLESQATEASRVVLDGATRVLRETEDSIASKFKGVEGDVLIQRLKQTVASLRGKVDYHDAATTLSFIMERYMVAYARAGSEVAQVVEEDLDCSPEIDRAIWNFYSFLASFGETAEWEKLEASFKTFLDHGRDNPDFNDLLQQLCTSVQELFTNPAFFDNSGQRFQDLRSKARTITARHESLQDDIECFLSALESTFRSILRDEDVASVLDTSSKIFKLLSSIYMHSSLGVSADLLNVYLPLLAQAVRYIPVPRLEISTPRIDLLLETLILEPGQAVNNSSFLPYKLRVETYNDLEIRKARFRTAATTKTMVRIKLDGLSVRADEMGFWLRTDIGLLRLFDQGIASFRLDKRGVDVHIEVEVGEDRLEKVLSLKKVDVHIHKLDWSIRKSRFSFVSWLFKPILVPIIRKAIETRAASAIGDGLKFANRELIFARERLRATRISNPGDLGTFVRAVCARLVPADDPDFQTRVGVDQPRKGVFQGVYTPASIVKLWEDEASHAPQRIREHGRDGWRNDIFDIHPSSLARR